MADNGNKVPTNPSVKTEPGSYRRLPSFRTPRDLKLTEFQKIASNPAEAKKKVYKPNLNVQRKKQNEEPTVVVKEKQSTAEGRGSERGSASEKGGRKERGRKKQPNLIQSSGVFSEGLAPSIKSGRWNSRFSDSSAPSMLERPKLKGPVKVNKEEEAMVMKDLLRDDFIDDPSYTPDVRQCPIKLPLKNFGGDFYCKLEEDTKAKREEDKTETNIVKVKVEVESDEASAGSVPTVETVPRTIDEMVPLTISQLISHTNDTSYIFFQLPHCMPREKTFLPANSKQHVSGKQAAQPSSSNSAPTQAEEKSVLKNLPEGQIGKLQILKSGEARLVLGDAKFMVDPGTQPSFKQDVIALVDMTSATRTGNMVHIGSVSSRMIVTPDWEALLKPS